MTTYIGNDVSKLLLDIHHHGQATQIPTTENAIRIFLRSLPADTMPVCESSGGDEALLITQAHAASRHIARINARQVRDFAKAKGRRANRVLKNPNFSLANYDSCRPRCFSRCFC